MKTIEVLKYIIRHSRAPDETDFTNPKVRLIIKNAKHMTIRALLNRVRHIRNEEVSSEWQNIYNLAYTQSKTLLWEVPKDLTLHGIEAFRSGYAAGLR